ncbi:MAG: transporter substrate-binding domain-containing protein [Anaerolineae bacterium]|nr:transporter substrate-binding domain-containing protein [Anaerolineae bacterium]
MRLRLGLLFVLLAIVLPTAAFAQDALPDLGGRTVTVAVENAYPPFNMIDETSGEGVGWDYDTINEICARLNCTPEYIQTSWDSMLLSVANGEFDIAADGITITEERAQSVDFSIGYVAVSQVLLTKIGEARFDTVAEFVANPDLVIGTQIGTTNYNTATQLVDESRIQAFDQFGVAVQALINGDVDAVIIDSTAGQGYVGENADQVVAMNESIQSDELGFAFPKGSDLVEPWNAALQSMMADDTLTLINARWFAPVLPDLGGRTVTVAVENAYPPFNMIDETSGEGVGWDYDTINEICARLNCTPEYVQTSWDSMLLSVANGEFDVAADGITITEERAQSVDFSMGYISVDQVLLTKIGEDRFSTVQEFVDNPELVIGTQIGTTNYNTATQLVDESRIQAFDQFGVAVQALINGDVDAVIIDSTAGQGYVGENADQVVAMNESIQSDLLGFAFPKGSDLVAGFNAALQSMIQDGTLEKINGTWFAPAGM